MLVISTSQLLYRRWPPGSVVVDIRKYQLDDIKMSVDQQEAENVHGEQL